MAEQYYSQDGQDEFLDRSVFKGRKSGFFVEIGAHDGVRFSNSAFLERERGWRGICVEPHPKIFPELVVEVKHPEVLQTNAKPFIFPILKRFPWYIPLIKRAAAISQRENAAFAKRFVKIRPSLLIRKMKSSGWIQGP